MCTCCQNYRSGTQSCGCCNCNRYCCASVQASASAGTSCASSCVRYVTFPISGMAVVPTGAIRFYPSWGNASSGTGGGSSCGCGTTVGGSSCGCGTTVGGNASSGCQSGTSSNSCGFGRCGGLTAISNYNEDYYNRQYGLNG